MEKKVMEKQDNKIINDILRIVGIDSGETETSLKKRLKLDLKLSSRLMNRRQARYLVDIYYQIQNLRIITGGHTRSLGDDNEPQVLPAYLMGNLHALEDVIKNALGDFAAEYNVGAWLQSLCGIGPVLSAGLLSTFDPRKSRTSWQEKKSGQEEGWITKTRQPTVGTWWSYAGLNPDQQWDKGKKRPFDARAKVLCYKVGESFVKVQNNPNDFYGKIFRERKDLEIARNADGVFEGQAAAKIEKFKIGKGTDAYAAYSTGKLPPAHLHSRARRYAVKLFLSHFHEHAYTDYYGTKPPAPFVFSKHPEAALHTHVIPAPPLPDKKGKSLVELWGPEDPRTDEERATGEKRTT